MGECGSRSGSGIARSAAERLANTDLSGVSDIELLNVLIVRAAECAHRSAEYERRHVEGRQDGDVEGS